MSNPNPPANINLGFLTVVQEASSFFGGYLVTNSWGRPLEFRLSSAVQPNRVQQILYGRTLSEYVAADLIGKTLLDKTGVPAHLLLTDSLVVLPIRSRVEIPVLAVVPENDPQILPLLNRELLPLNHPRSTLPLVYAERFRGDAPLIRELLERVDAGLDLSEPFGRIREAMAEARKTGGGSRAA